MAGVNKVIIVGNLGSDPDYKTLPQGATVAKLSVATSEQWKDKSGEKKERTEWHRVVCWGKLADIVSKYTKKGDKVYLEGKIQTRSWEKDGQKHYSTEVIADTVQFLGKAGGGSANTTAQTGDDHLGPPPGFDSEEEIPF